MNFLRSLTLSDIIDILTFLSIVIGGIFAYGKWALSLKLKRSEYLNELTRMVNTDEIINKTIYMIDYGQLWYSESFHNNGDLEKKVDHTLSFYSYICYLRKRKVIKEPEFSFFRYDIERALNNSQVVDYLYNLYHFTAKFKMPRFFNYLYNYSKEKKLFKSDFYDNKAWRLPGARYHHYLNF